jgi:hypothetical protein
MSMKCGDELKLIPSKSVSFGSISLQIHAPDEIQEAQLGYSVDPDGNSLITDEEGSWKKNWLVIGYEDLCGDPIFVDTQTEGCPVYTAMHGAGNWNPILIASSIKSFAKALEIISELGEGRENPVKLETNLLPSGSRDEALKKIRKDNPEADLSFWADWLD